MHQTELPPLSIRVMSRCPEPPGDTRLRGQGACQIIVPVLADEVDHRSISPVQYLQHLMNSEHYIDKTILSIQYIYM